MKCVSFNVNSIRTRLHQLEAVVAKYNPDFIGLQETKVVDGDFPVAAIEKLGYHVEFFGQPTHYGVALMSKIPFAGVQKGFAGDDDTCHKRFICGEFNLESGHLLTVINGYFPQGESRDHPTKFPNKQKFYSDLFDHLCGNCSPDKPLIVMGDMNISPNDDDIGIGEDNRLRWIKQGKCSFLPEEREWLKKVTDWGLLDTYRHPALARGENEEKYSWFDYRSKGFERDPKRGLRIDFVLATQCLADRCIAAGIDYDIRAMERPSDHCPVWAEFDGV